VASAVAGVSDVRPASASVASVVAGASSGLRPGTAPAWPLAGSKIIVSLRDRSPHQ
jgi:hypothetical protein